MCGGGGGGGIIRGRCVVVVVGVGGGGGIIRGRGVGVDPCRRKLLVHTKATIVCPCVCFSLGQHACKRQDPVSV